MNENERAIFAGSVLFGGMDGEFTARAAALGREAEYAAGDDILSEGGRKKMLAVLVSGTAAVYKGDGADRVEMSVQRAGSLIGAATLFLSEGAATRVTARTRCRVVMFTEEQVSELMRESFEFTRRYLAYLTERVHFLAGRVASMGCTTGVGKLMSHLARAAEDGAVELPDGMNGLAATLSISRATLYRAMDAAVEKGYIRRDGNTIYVLQ